MAIGRMNMAKQVAQPPAKKRASKSPKNMGGKLPAAIGKKQTDHGKMNFRKGGMVGKDC